MSESFEDARPVVPAASRELPHSIEAEENLLSCCLLDSADVISRCVLAGVTPLSFYYANHGIVFDCITRLFNAQKSVELEVVAEELQSARQLESVGGYPFLIQMSQRSPTTLGAAYFIERVKALSTLRSVIRACTGAIEQCYVPDVEIETLMSDIGNRVQQATGQLGETAEEPFQETAKRFFEEITVPEVEQKQPVGEISWGLVDIDRNCGKLAPGTLVVLAGMPSTGKSALADAVAWGAAATGKETLVFTYEMTKREKAIRIAQQVSHLNYDKFNGAPTDRKLTFIAAARMISECKTLHVFERDTSVNRLVARARAFANRGKKIGLVVVDFLQYLSRLEPHIGRERTDEKVGRLTAALKQLARDCDCPVLLLSSLNRDGYKEGNRPTLSSLRSSGEIESDADVVAILHWPKKHPVSGDEQDFKGSNYVAVEFNQDKGRTKGVNGVLLNFDRQATKFENMHA